MVHADDTSPCHHSHDLTQMIEAIIAISVNWRLRFLSLNVAKTHSMLISSKQKHNPLKSGNEALELKIRDN